MHLNEKIMHLIDEIHNFLQILLLFSVFKGHYIFLWSKSMCVDRFLKSGFIIWRIIVIILIILVYDLQIVKNGEKLSRVRD